MPSKRSSKIGCKTELSALRDHIKDLHKQLITSRDDLARLQLFVNQPLLDEPMVKSYAVKTTYTAARQRNAIEYAEATLGSISDVVTIIGTNISNANARLKGLEGDSGKALPKTKNGLNKIYELTEEVWELHEKVKKQVDLIPIVRL